MSFNDFNTRVKALLVWLKVFSEKLKIPELESLEDVWKDHLGSLGYVCHANEMQKKSFPNSADAFQDAKFVLGDLQEVKDESQKILFYTEVDFDAAAKGDKYETYKCVILMVTEVLLYFRRSSGRLADPYVEALQNEELEEAFTEMIGQVINPSDSWWKCGGMKGDALFKMPLPVREEVKEPTTPQKPRHSLYTTPKQTFSQRPSMASINLNSPVGSTRSPLKDLLDSPRIQALSERREVLKLRNRIDELNEEMEDKNREIKLMKEKGAENNSSYNDIKQRLKEKQREVDDQDATIKDLEAINRELKKVYEENVINIKDACERGDKYKKTVEQDEIKIDELQTKIERYEQEKKETIQQLKDAHERLDASERAERTFETKLHNLQSELDYVRGELASVQGNFTAERRSLKEQMEQKEQDYENILFQVQTKLAATDRSLIEKNEELEALSNDFRLKLQNEQKDCEQKISAIKAALEKELERHKLLLAQHIADSTEEKQRYVTEIQMLNEMLANTLKGKTDEHDQMVNSLKRQHELELMSLRSKMDLNEQLVERQKQDVERYKNEVMSTQESLLKSLEAELAACNKQNELVTEKDQEIQALRNQLHQERQMRASSDTERQTIKVKRDETDRYWRSEVEQASQLLKEATKSIVIFKAEKDEKVKEISILREEMERMKYDHEAEINNLRQEMEEHIVQVQSQNQILIEEPEPEQEEQVEAPPFRAPINLDETVVKSRSFNDSNEFDNQVPNVDGDEEPTQMLQSCIGTRQTENFFVDFNNSKEDEEENDENVAVRQAQENSRLSLASASRMSMTSGNSMFSEGRTSSAHSAIPEFPSDYSMYTKASDRDRYSAKGTDRDRIEVLKRRNNAVPPALKSSYPTEFGDYKSPNGSENSVKGTKATGFRRKFSAANISKSFSRLKK